MKNDGSKPSRFLFVDGPSLGRGANSSSRNTRSALIRRLLSERQAAYRQKEEDKRQRLITQRDTETRPVEMRWCTCREPVADQGRNLAMRPIVTQMPDSDTILIGLCGVCGRLRTFNQRSDRGVSSVSLNPSPGRADPFSTVDPNLGPDVDGLIHHAVADIWPNFRSAGYAGKCYQSWIATGQINKLLLYSNLWAASCHRDVLRISYGCNPAMETHQQLYYKGRLLNLLREHVPDFTNEEWRDGIIMAILYLAVNETKTRDLTRDPSPFTPPFVNMQLLSFYGSRDYHSLHWNVICDMLRQLGGIQSIKVYGLGWLVSISSLMNAAHTLTKPRFPMVDVEGNMTYFSPSVHSFPFPINPSEESDLGFGELGSTFPPVKVCIVEVFNILSLYSAMIQWSYNRNLDEDDCDKFADFRNQVHHTLFSLPDENDPLDSVLDMHGSTPDQAAMVHDLYLTCRLAANLYALHVTFPVPRSGFLRQLILPLLATRLDRLTRIMSSPLLLWCAAIAAMAAEEAPEFCRFTDQVKVLCRKLRITSYICFVKVLQSFAWVEIACSEACSRLWENLDITDVVGHLELRPANAV